MNQFVLEMYLLDQYGPRLNTDQLAKALGLTKGAVYNQISSGQFPVRTYLDSGKRWADCRDVAAHLEHCRAQARCGELLDLPLRTLMPSKARRRA